ncbi:hypothetical protein GCM10010289_58090 [Streptomyces violascens]|nr:hypothetical protein GCM10010289_58090 [Streptomyces violascens]
MTSQILMWVDEDAGVIGNRANRAAYSLTRLYIHGALPYCGDVVFAGSTTANGDLRGLSADQASALVEAYLDHVAPDLIPRQFVH